MENLACSAASQLNIATCPLFSALIVTRLLQNQDGFC
jgi:hypothetical protein